MNLLSNIDNKSIIKAKKDIIDSINETLAEIDAYSITKKAIAENFKFQSPVYLVSLGKAAISMAKAAEKLLNTKDGIIITNKKCKSTNLKCIKPSHPIVSKKSIEAAEAVLNLIKNTKENDTILFLISGGGSALVELPHISLKNLQKTNDILIKSSLTINEINCIRKHLSKIKGGKMLRYTKAKTVSLIISDVIDNDISTIASGLTYYDRCTFKDAIDIIESHNLTNKLPKETLDFLMSNKAEYETVKEEEFGKYNTSNLIISSNDQAVNLIKKHLEQKGYSVILGPKLTNSIKEASQTVLNYISNIKSNTAVVFGGEVTVDVKVSGTGGRNQHFALLIAKYLTNKNTVFAAFATDGKDGNSSSAGAISDSDTKKRAEKLKLNIDKYLKNFDSFHFFKQLNDTIETEDTNTNLTDIYIAIKY